VTLTVADMASQDAGASGDRSPGKEGPRAGQRKRRTFTAAYKSRTLAEYEACSTPGARGALLRREGLYHSHILSWRRAAESGTESAPASGAGPAKSRSAGESTEIRRLKKENTRLAAELARNKTAMEALGKMVGLLEMLSEGPDTQKP
jgi:transposase